MRRLLFFFCALAGNSYAQQIPGLREPVEVIRDHYGVNHIYAKNEHDLFFAQGYCAAKDRLFQFEMWRIQATGTAAEIFGAKELKRDIGARRFRYRGNLSQELNHYHTNGEAIVRAFTDGVNAYIREALKDPAKLPMEFKLLGIKPKEWTPEVVISRHQGLLGNIGEEILTGKQVAAVGAGKARELDVFEPGEPILDIDPAIDQEKLVDNVIELYNEFRKSLAIKPEDLVVSANTNKREYQMLAMQDAEEIEKMIHSDDIGSNNWIISGGLSQSGYPVLANDPHRALAAPSLRYMVHLNAPGWNVVGGGEPTIPGISVGHNDYGAWGLTIFSIDGEDLYVYELNPSNKLQYKYQGRWEDMRVVKDTIHVKGSADVFIDHLYTRHGPVSYVDEKNTTAYAIRCAWLEPGGAPYLASLRIDQAKDWNEFRNGCSYSHIPGENMIWADRKGDIGWQAVGIAPIRKNWSGLVPVPGDGRYEWSGYLPITELPHTYNPSKGFWATANENLVPLDYPHNNAVGANWADPYRANRVNEVLGSGKIFSQADMMRLQFDYLSIPARNLVPFLKDLKSADVKTEGARQLLLDWNFVMDKNSVAAGIYSAWEKKIGETITPLFVPAKALSLYRYIPVSRMVEWITTARPEFGKNPVEDRNAFLVRCLENAVKDLVKKLGPEMTKWQYGQPSYHHVLIKHPLSNAVDEATRKKLEVGPLPRGGNGSTPGMTGNSDNQVSGASFRIVADTRDWDQTMFTNAPGQSGNPDSPFYRNLFPMWANDQHFPVYFSREKIEKNAAEKLTLTPQ
ncbi:MAG TPA: penicillin acylase family protein [Cyclobacteriaceae bacterium]|nr:penicillin acylase family protein [Cyclobacteriaceae bacterium]